MHAVVVLPAIVQLEMLIFITVLGIHMYQVYTYVHTRTLTHIYIHKCIYSGTHVQYLSTGYTQRIFGIDISIWPSFLVCALAISLCFCHSLTLSVRWLLSHIYFQTSVRVSIDFAPLRCFRFSAFNGTAQSERKENNMLRSLIQQLNQTSPMQMWPSILM